MEVDSFSANVAAALGATVALPLVIPAALGQPPMSVPRYAAELRRVANGVVRIAAFGKGSAARIDDGAGLPTFAELFVSSRLRNVGWNCTWASAYPILQYIESWSWDSQKPSISPPPAHVLEILDGIAAIRQSLTKPLKRPFGGIPDVIAWRGLDLLMIECKRRKEDQIRQNQAEWMQATVLAGMTVSQLGVFEWHYADELGSKDGRP
jgi:hypothetical protein